MKNPYDFTGKKIIVAGATSGIGKATAIRLAEMGAELHLIGRNQQKLDQMRSELSNASISTYTMDLAVENDFKKLFDSVVSDGQKIDGLVYCAGLAKILPVGLMKKKNMDDCMTVNFYSFVEMVSMLARRKYHNAASIVGVSSISTLYPQKCQGLYVASKSAMNSVAAALAIELAPKGIRINTVMPSSTNTEMLREAFDLLEDDVKQRSIDRQLLGIAEPEDVADVILFLLSDASRIVTGRSLYADAGYLNFQL